MFGLLSRSVAAFVASVSGTSPNKSTSEEQLHPDNVSGSSSLSPDGKSNKTNGNRRESSGKGMNRPKHPVERVQAQNIEEVVQFLIDNFTQSEAILASLHIENQEDLNILLTDLVKDCVQCSSTCLVRCPNTGQVNGVCLASKATIFDMQIDRLCSYEFKEDRIATAIEFLKYVFNRLDPTYHFEENKIYKPIFVAIVSVRKELWGRGIANSMLDACMAAAKEDRCDGAIALASNTRACQLISKRFPMTIQSIKYDTFRGQHRNPPIVMPKDETQRALYVMLSKF